MELIETGLGSLYWGHIVMWLIACAFIYLGIAKKMEPLLLVPIGFGMLLVNLPLGDLFLYTADGDPEGLLSKIFVYLIAGEIIPPLIFLCFNGFLLGAVVSVLQSRISNVLIIASLAPHGIIEIPAIVLAAALGLKVGFESIRFLINRRSNVKVQLHQSLVIYAKWILIMLFVAALIETFATPLLVARLGGIELNVP